jgi:hypothetical protein
MEGTCIIYEQQTAKQIKVARYLGTCLEITSRRAERP